MGSFLLTGVCNFKISGRMHHLIDQNLRGEVGAELKHAQHFIIDGDHMKRPIGFEEIHEGLLNDLWRMLKVNNHFARELRRVVDVAAESGNPSLDYRVVFSAGDTPDRRLTNAPQVAEIAALIPDGGPTTTKPHDVVFYLNSGQMCRSSDLNAAHMPMHYPLLFPHGELGWHLNIGFVPRPSKFLSWCFYDGMLSSLLGQEFFTCGGVWKPSCSKPPFSI